MSRDEQLRIIGQQVQDWLDYHDRILAKAGLAGITPSDESAVILAKWPTRGQLKKWREVLFDEAN